MPHFYPKFPLNHFQFLLPLINLFLVPSTIFGHIILTFPEARYPPFDFLDSPRTLGPCGVPKSLRSPQTHFQSGKAYKLSWRMATENENDTIRLSLLNENDNFVQNGVRGKNDADPLISSNKSGAQFTVAEFYFPLECRNCTLLLEKQGGEGNLERSCAEIDIKNEELSLTERCNENGKWANGHCQCEHGFSGELCQNRGAPFHHLEFGSTKGPPKFKDDCENDSECGQGGKCVQDGIIPGQKSCFCQFGFFGTNCERRSDPDPADQKCFHHNGPSPSNADGQFHYGLFNPECYQRKDLNENDRLYWRLMGNHLELILDFATNSWVALGWRPLQIPPSCRLFPQIDSTSDIELAKTSGFAKEWLESPLHPMDCVDLVMGSVIDGTFLHIADMYSRDKSSPLKDGWFDGEESLSAAYGFKSNTNRTILMFRRLVPEIEPTDHPLGPGPIFVIYAKGNSKMDGQWEYHGNEGQNRGHLQLEFVPPSQMNRIRGPLIHLESTSAETTTKEEKTMTTKTIKITELTSISPIQTTTTTVNAAKSKLSKESKGIGSIWMRTKENNDGEKEGKLTTTTMESGLHEKMSTTKSATKHEENEEENEMKLDEQKQDEKGNKNNIDGREELDEENDVNDEVEEPLNSLSNHVGIRNSGAEEWEEFLKSSSMALASSFPILRLLFISFFWLIILRLYG